MTRSYLFVGDTHGDHDFTSHAADLAAEHDAEMIQVGDWGFLWPSAPWGKQRPHKAFMRLSSMLVEKGVVCRFVDGNHDWHPKLSAYVNNDPSAAYQNVGVEIALNVIYQPRGSTFEDEDGTRFLFCGGAPSIDHVLRRPGHSWWPEEVISEAEYQLALFADGPFDVLVTHDAPDYPPGFSPKGDSDFRVRSARSMAMVRGLVEHHRPPLHVHGHWHAKYSTHLGATKVVGLNCNFAKFPDAVMLWSRV